LTGGEDVMSRTPKPLLETIQGPADLKGLSFAQLQQVCNEMRQDLIEVIPALPCGGHFGANLGTVELTVALHYLFDTPTDKLIWDVGHQAYPHKMLTGRLAGMPTIRQTNGVAPFCKTAESPHDVFGAGHGGTSVSAAVGFALARDLAGENHHVVAVVGDGSLTAGESFEGLDHGGSLKSPLIVVVNDNGMGISANVGALSDYLTQIRVGKGFNWLKEHAEGLLRKLPLGEELVGSVELLDRSMRHALLPSIYFEDLGFEYLGPVDAHCLDSLVRTLRFAKSRRKPVVVHILSEKGKGYEPAESDPGKLHAVKPKSTGPKLKAYTDVFVEVFDRLATLDPRVVGVTAAMLDGTGLAKLVDKYPGRVLDVGMAEQHAVTCCAALAMGGRRPVAAIYSTFLQRAYDQVLHDVAIHNAPVIFCLDRAGCVGNDGPTHQGLFDLAYLRHIPNMVVMAPRDEVELGHMLYTALKHTDSPAASPLAVRYPRTSVEGLDLPDSFRQLEIGRGELLREGQGLALLGIGTLVNTAVEAADALARDGLTLTVADARFCKPLDAELILDLARRHDDLVTIEDHVVQGGFGSAVAELLATSDVDCRLTILGVPDEFVEHGEREDQLAWYGLDVAGLIRTVRGIVEGESTQALKLVG
jgi:1-deoxy-D-xylulose-5-phosphate synthase